MQLIIDTERQRLTRQNGSESRELPLFSKESFEMLSEQWVRIGWNEKHIYTFTWLGRPIIQLPEDLIRAQEVIYQLQPDVIIETGVAHGGSLVFYASLCKLIGRGRVVGVDIEIRPHNRTAIEEHPLSSLITLVEGNSIAEDVVEQVAALVQPGESVMVFLDSCHSRSHVLGELEAYSGLVTPGSYIVAADGVLQDLFDVPRGTAGWQTDNPATAVDEFLMSHPDFEVEQPKWLFNESPLTENVTHWPTAWLKRRGNNGACSSSIQHAE